MENKIFGNLIPLLTEEEYADKEGEVFQRRKANDPHARLQVMYHVATHLTTQKEMVVIGFEAMALEPRGDITEEILSAAVDEIREAAVARFAHLDEILAEEKAAAFAAEPHYTEDGRTPNAVLVRAEGGAALLHLDDFVDSEALGAPLACTRVDRVHRRLPEWGEKTFGISLVGYVDESGLPKGLPENERIASLSGYDEIAGDCVLLRTDERYNYLPLLPADAVRVWKHFS